MSDTCVLPTPSLKSQHVSSTSPVSFKRSCSLSRSSQHATQVQSLTLRTIVPCGPCTGTTMCLVIKSASHSSHRALPIDACASDCMMGTHRPVGSGLTSQAGCRYMCVVIARSVTHGVVGVSVYMASASRDGGRLPSRKLWLGPRDARLAAEAICF